MPAMREGDRPVKTSRTGGRRSATSATRRGPGCRSSPETTARRSRARGAELPGLPRPAGLQTRASCTGVMGGIGRCGLTLCCATWLTDFNPVSIKMAKQQDLPLSPMEISGVCGRLLCCLAYENDAYSAAKARLPKQGEIIDTEHGRGKIVAVNVIKETVQVELESQVNRRRIVPGRGSPALSRSPAATADDRLTGRIQHSGSARLDRDSKRRSLLPPYVYVRKGRTSTTFIPSSSRNPRAMVAALRA